MKENPGLYALLFLGFVSLGLLGYLFRKPLGLFLKLFRNTMLGSFLLILLNTIGLSMGINLYTSLAVGLFGIPGIIALYILKTILL